MKLFTKKYRFEASTWDVVDRGKLTPDDGTIVVKCQPYGCPKNGTMNHCYIADADTGMFYGLVHLDSLHQGA